MSYFTLFLVLRFQNLLCHIYSASQIQITHILNTPLPLVASSDHAGQHRARGTNKRKEENKGNEGKVRRSPNLPWPLPGKMRYFIGSRFCWWAVISRWIKYYPVQEKYICLQITFTYSWKSYPKHYSTWQYLNHLQMTSSFSLLFSR